jgi:prolipoprotein diacylglyceryltransferase
MENQVNEQPLNVKGLILLIGTIFGALISFAKGGTLLSIVGGLVGGLIVAAIFISLFLPHKESDR